MTIDSRRSDGDTWGPASSVGATATMSGPFREHGVDIDMASLVHPGERNHVVDYLRAKGWDVDGVTRTELFKRNGMDVPAPENDDPLGEIIFISGNLTR